MQDSISQTGWLEYQKVAEELSQCSIGIIAKTPTINNIIGGPPIKYYNYTAAGMAILDVDMPETTRLLSKYKNGISIRNRTAQGIADGLIELVENKGLLAKYRSNSVSAFSKLNWDNEGKKLVDFYSNSVLNPSTIIKH